MLKIKTSKKMIEELFDSLSKRIKKQRYRSSKEKKKFDLEFEILGFEVQNLEISIEMLNNSKTRKSLEAQFSITRERFQKLTKSKSKIDELRVQSRSSRNESRSQNLLIFWLKQSPKCHIADLISYISNIHPIFKDFLQNIKLRYFLSDSETSVHPKDIIHLHMV